MSEHKPHSRILDSFLEETLGGKEPPDLRERILDTLHSQIAHSVLGRGVGSSVTPTPPKLQRFGSGKASGGAR